MLSQYSLFCLQYVVMSFLPEDHTTPRVPWRSCSYSYPTIPMKEIAPYHHLYMESRLVIEIIFFLFWHTANTAGA